MKISTLALLLLCSAAAIAQKNEISVLNNRFYFVFPDSARNVARSTDIMGPGPNENEETRVIYDEGDKRLVFFARELHVKTTANLAERLANSTSSTNVYTVKSIYRKDSFVAVLMTPQKFDSTKNAILINSVVIQNPDSTLCRVDAFINPAAFTDKSKFQLLTEQVFSTFKEGGRRINLAAHTDTFAVMGSKTKLQLKVPKNYVVTKSKGEDFDVYRIERVPDYGEEEQSSIVVYFGFYPSLFSREYELTKFRTPDTEEELMFHKGPWENYVDTSRNLILREQLFNDDEIEKGMQEHIAILSNNKDRIDEMSAIVKDLLIVYDPAHVK